MSFLHSDVKSILEYTGKQGSLFKTSKSSHSDFPTHYNITSFNLLRAKRSIPLEDDTLITCCACGLFNLSFYPQFIMTHDPQ